MAKAPGNQTVQEALVAATASEGLWFHAFEPSTEAEGAAETTAVRTGGNPYLIPTVSHCGQQGAPLPSATTHPEEKDTSNILNRPLPTPPDTISVLQIEKCKEARALHTDTSCSPCDQSRQTSSLICRPACLCVNSKQLNTVRRELKQRGGSAAKTKLGWDECDDCKSQSVSRVLGLCLGRLPVSWQALLLPAACLSPSAARIHLHLVAAQTADRQTCLAVFCPNLNRSYSQALTPAKETLDKNTCFSS
ncbi:hypothetical protein AAFF_G00283700 [Aldrovandia affinis]|uniref:Uncharacterized protein n=1 Tax=Aldrovandia affinis TaxID=143900 RepID=A0AAD7TAF9_9TELE|nr:hypothetical protein AAFF_G00283700 [Aldrovandia affinis]